MKPNSELFHPVIQSTGTIGLDVKNYRVHNTVVELINVACVTPHPVFKYVWVDEDNDLWVIVESLNDVNFEIPIYEANPT